jgi:hypothetical protein
MLAQGKQTKNTTPLRSSDEAIYETTVEATRTTSSGAAGLAAVGSGLFPVRLNILVSIGAFDLLSLHGKSLGPVAVNTTVAIWLIAVVALGFAARSGRRWAFLVGIVLYGADMITLISMFSLWAFGVHAFFVFRWFQGQKALKDYQHADVSTF